MYLEVVLVFMYLDMYVFMYLEVFACSTIIKIYKIEKIKNKCRYIGILFSCTLVYPQGCLHYPAIFLCA